MVAAILLPAMLFAALIPSGFMPAVHADGTWTITICTADGPQVIRYDAEGKHLPDDPLPENERASNVCAFAFTAAYVQLWVQTAVVHPLRGPELWTARFDHALTPGQLGLRNARGPPPFS
ncbi:hypothetical protein GCM10011316_20530 [Roseibium aquae]|uniref:DUF2946 family protein n=1 Tax=Roseibium aquae TaxID=1323746 RepID=A0A916TK59_9HYPH|nr:DUF2946 family protein [Roseibium aquae]GGB48268.1 hypothetical protein GCM10011316_20530 [Roseibium aquae]